MRPRAILYGWQIDRQYGCRNRASNGIFCVTSSAGGSRDKEHFLGYPLHVSFPVWATGNEVESGEAEAEEVS
jgi:hypothetical protein